MRCASRDSALNAKWKQTLLLLLVNDNSPIAAGLAYHAADILYEAVLAAADGEPVSTHLLELLLDVSCQTVLRTNKPLLQKRIRCAFLNAQDWAITMTVCCAWTCVP